MSSPPRRITRAALARFAYNNNASSSSSSAKPPPDIEDAIPPATTTRKRKRTTQTSAAIASSSSSAAVVKTETATTTRVKKEEEDEETKDSKTAIPRRARKPARRVIDPDTAEATTEPPTDWEEMYEVVRAMRFGPGGAAANAAVDTMGCERLAEPGASARDQRFQTLVALMLSSQTKDTTTAVAMKRLQTELEAAPAPLYSEGGAAAQPGLTLDNMLAAAPERVNELIRLVGFHNNKTRYLKQTAEILRDRCGGDIPDSFAGLTSLPGVGPKMAHLCLSAAWGRTEGIGVDVHVHRLTNMWGWHTTRNPEDTRRALEAWLPRDRWHEINTLLVGLGQTVCGPVSHRCGDCDLGLRGLCRAADRAKVNQGRKAKAKKEEEGVKVELKAEVEIGEDGGEEVKEASAVVKKEEIVEVEDDAGGEEGVVKKEEPAEAGVQSVAERSRVVKKEETEQIDDRQVDVKTRKKEETEEVRKEVIKKEESVALPSRAAVKSESVAVENMVKREDVTDEEKTVVKGEDASDDDVKQELESTRRVRRRRR